MRGAVLVAALLDAALGEPPLGCHPVVWAGRYLDRVGARVPAAPAGTALATGGAAWAVGAVAAAGAGAAVGATARRLPRGVDALVVGTALWPLLSGRMLLAEVAGVGTALDRGDDEGRRAVSRIVSRETGTLSGSEVRAAAIESLAENLSDSLVATLLWYSVAGLPAAALHRFANTADAMWGYRSPRWEHAGKVAARADDLLNLAPARLTALLLAGPRARPRVRGEARQVPSPNAGWPMAAMALRLDVRLVKPGVHVLHDPGRTPAPADLRVALAVATRAAVAAAAVAVLLDLAPRPALSTRPAPTTHRGER